MQRNNSQKSAKAWYAIALSATILIGCGTTPKEGEEDAYSVEKTDVSETKQQQTIEKRWLLAEQADAHYLASCPTGTAFIPPEPIELTVTKVELTNINTPEAQPIKMLNSAELNGIEFVAGYHLTSENPRLGGISGIDSLRNGDLLTVTDQGDFLWIGMDEYEHLQPVSARISMLRDKNGNPYDNKAAADSEGLAVDNGLALVSFEQTHRIEAFDLETCGANARGSLVFSLDKDTNNVKKISPNGGIEALALTAEGGLIMGIESLVGDESQVSISPRFKMADFHHRLGTSDGKQITGSDFYSTSTTGGELYSLHRSYSPLTGARISLLRTNISLNSENEYEIGESSELLSLKAPGITDNFEGITVRKDENGKIRLFIVSDDNFSSKQRSLLLIFDVIPTAY